MARKKSQRELPLEIRIAVVVMRYFFNLNWTDIGNRLDIHPRSVQAIYARAAARAASSTDFKEITACVGSMEREGRPLIITEGTPASI
jgi:hypothetical protein